MGVRLADIVGVLDAAYPPALAESWDSVGLVCGDPDQQIDTVTVAVDATAAVVDEMDGPGAHLLLAHHPLLLRGVDTVAASTPKGALVHRLIRAGGALFTAHTNADSASPGVSDALAQALGLTVTSVLAPRFTDYDKWVVFVPTESVHAVRQPCSSRCRTYRCLLGLFMECHRHRPIPAVGGLRSRCGGAWCGGTGRRGPRGDGCPVAAALRAFCGDSGRPPLRGSGHRRAAHGAGAVWHRPGADRRPTHAGDLARLRIPCSRCLA